MNILRFKSQAVGIVVLLLTIGVFASCSKDDEPSSFPKDVSITYKITKVAGTITSGDVQYSNESGGFTNDQDAPLPFTKVVERSIEQYEIVGLDVVTDAGGTIKLEILVDGKTVQSQEFTDDADFIVGNITYQFK